MQPMIKSILTQKMANVKSNACLEWFMKTKRHLHANAKQAMRPQMDVDHVRVAYLDANNVKRVA